MRIKRIRFENFGGFKSFELELMPFTALLGLNNAGKTTVLRGIKFALKCIEHWFSRCNPEHYETELVQGEFPAHDLVKQSMAVDGRTLFCQSTPSDVCKFELETDSEAGDLAFHLAYFRRNNHCKVQMLWRNQKVSAQVSKHIPDIVAVLSKTQAYYVPALGALAATGRVLEYNAVQNQLSSAQFATTWRNQVQWLNEGKSPERFQAVVARLRQFFPEVTLVPPQRDRDSNIGVRFDYEELGNRFDVFAAGGGIRTLVSLLVTNELSDAPILLLDEPDSSLHPSLQRRVAQFLFESAQHGKQIILTTHAPDFIEELPLDSLFWIDRSKQAARKAADVGEVLVDLGAISHSLAMQFIGSDTLVFVEYPDDGRIICAFMKLCGFDDLAKRTVFLPLHGFGDSKYVRGVERVITRRLRANVAMAVIVDPDFRQDASGVELDGNVLLLTLPWKEIENAFLFDALAWHKAVEVQLRQRAMSSGRDTEPIPTEREILMQIDLLLNDAEVLRETKRRWIEQQLVTSPTDDSVDIERALSAEFDEKWAVSEWRKKVCSGKVVVRKLRSWLGTEYRVESITERPLLEYYRPPEEVRLMFGALENHVVARVATARLSIS